MTRLTQRTVLVNLEWLRLSIVWPNVQDRLETRLVANELQHAIALRNGAFVDAPAVSMDALEDKLGACSQAVETILPWVGHTVFSTQISETALLLEVLVQQLYHAIMCALELYRLNHLDHLPRLLDDSQFTFCDMRFLAFQDCVLRGLKGLKTVRYGQADSKAWQEIALKLLDVGAVSTPNRIKRKLYWKARKLLNIAEDVVALFGFDSIARRFTDASEVIRHSVLV